MPCACGKRARLAAQGKKLQGYRLYVNDQIIPPKNKPPYFSQPDVKAEQRRQGGGLIAEEYEPWVPPAPKEAPPLH